MNFYSIQLRQDTLSNWNLHPDLVLKAGEIALVSTDDTAKYDAYKIGDGTTIFSELPLYYLILSDSDGNPIILNPETGTPLDFAQVDEYTKKVDLSLSHDFIVELSPLLRISALQTGKTYPRPFISDVSGLQVGRTYNIVPTEAAISGQVTLLSKDPNTGEGNYLLELTSIYYLENICKVVLMMYGSTTEDTWQVTQAQSQVLPYNHNIDLSSELSTFDDLHYRVIIARQTNTPLFVTYLGDIYYNPSILGERIMFIKFSPNTLPENQESMEYLRLDFLYVEKGIDPGVEYNITTYTRLIRILKDEDLLSDLWTVNLPSAMGQMLPQQTLPVEDLWGSVEEFQNWIKGLDPEKQGVSAWDALLTYNFTRRGTLSKRVDVISGIKVPYYFASLIREDDSGLYIDRYKIYNNPDNNTVPIGDVVWFMGSYSLTEDGSANIFDDSLSTLPEANEEAYEKYRDKIVGIPLIKNGSIVGFDEYRIAWNLDTDNPVYFWEKMGGGNAVLTSELEVSNPLGRYSMGEIIPQDTPLETVFRGILSKTYYPVLTAPSVSIDDPYPTLMAVNDTVSFATVREVFSRGSINPQYTSESPYRSGEATNYNLKIDGAFVYNPEMGVWDVMRYNEYNSTGIFNVRAEFTRFEKGKVTLIATVNHEAGVQPKDSEGNNYQSPLPAGTVSKVKEIEFILPFYYGVSDGNIVDDFAGLIKDLTKKSNKTYTFTTNNQYAVIAYDASYGNLKEIKDQNGFEVQWVASEVVVGGQTYKVYAAAYATTAISSKFTFNF